MTFKAGGTVIMPHRVKIALLYNCGYCGRFSEDNVDTSVNSITSLYI